MVESILSSIKGFLGIDAMVTNFDSELIMYINAAIMSLQQLGIGPTTGFSIYSDNETWADLLGARIDLDGAKLYLGFKVRLAFDPPQNGFLVDAIKNQISELEFRLNVQAEGGPFNG